MVVTGVSKIKISELVSLNLIDQVMESNAHWMVLAEWSNSYAPCWPFWARGLIHILAKVIERMRAYRASMEEWRRQCESEETIRRQAIMKSDHQGALQLRLVENMQ